MRAEFYRLRAEEIHNKLLQIKEFSIKHNLTLGMFAEDLLRDLLKMLLPKKVDITQGFIVNKGLCSHQCDIIVYDCFNFAPVFKTGDVSILPSQSVIAVVEVKTVIDRKQFKKTLDDFTLLNKMGVKYKYLFVYNSCSIRTLSNYFFSDIKKEKVIHPLEITTGLSKYDYGNYDELPDAIIGLKPKHEYFLKKDYVITNDRDMVGCTSLIFNDKEGRPISCLEEFVTMLLSKFGDIPLESEYGCSFNKYEGISLFDM